MSIATNLLKRVGESYTGDPESSNPGLDRDALWSLDQFNKEWNAFYQDLDRFKEKGTNSGFFKMSCKRLKKAMAVIDDMMDYYINK